jgi:hypothetical protein
LRSPTPVPVEILLPTLVADLDFEDASSLSGWQRNPLRVHRKRGIESCIFQPDRK